MATRLAARVGDPTEYNGVIITGDANVEIGGARAARRGDRHFCGRGAGRIVEGCSNVTISGRPAARKLDGIECSAYPPALTGADIMDDAEAFLRRKGKDLDYDDAEEREEEIREILQDDRDLRLEMALDEHADGALALEIFSNATQRSRWIHKNTGPLQGIAGALGADDYDKEKIGSDLGSLFAGIRDVPEFLDADHTYNINVVLGEEGPLPFTGFQEKYRDTAAPEWDQTHHLAFFVMLSTYDPWLVDFLTGMGTGGPSPLWNDYTRKKFAEAVGWYIDRDGNVPDQSLAYVGADLGSKLGDGDFNVNRWIWEHIGDPHNVGDGPLAERIQGGEETVWLGDDDYGGAAALWPSLPGEYAATFTWAEPIELPAGTKLFRIIGPDNNPAGAFWMLELPGSMDSWRARYAVISSWNEDGTYVEYTVPPGGLMVWFGPAAPQSEGSESYSGGGIQVFVPPGAIQPGPSSPTGW
jgi:uncharacterized Zn-binding protein involved in type VI secretion